MRILWILAGVVGASSVAVASPNAQFYTVINYGDSIAGDNFYAPEQVVVGDGGVVATVGALINSGNNIVIYSTPTSNNQWSNQSVVEDNTPIDVSNGLGANQEFSTYYNLALTGNPSGGTRLTFYTTSATNGDQAGILQWDSGDTNLSDVAFDDDGKGYSDVGGNFEVNGSGQVISSAVNASKQVLFTGDGSSAPSNIFVTSGTLSLVDPNSRIALAADGSGAAPLDSSGTDGVYNIPANGGTPTEVSGSQIPVHGNPYQGEPLMGYVSNNSLSATLMLVTNSNGSANNIVLSKNGSAPQSILAGPFTPGAAAPSNPQGEMSPDGRIAVYVPDNNGVDDTIQYANAAALNTSASVVASVAPVAGAVPDSAIALNPSGSNLYIESLNESGDDWVPEVNDSGTIAFLANVGTSPTDPDPNTALLDWQPGDASPTVLLAVGDQQIIGSQTETISDLFFNQLAEENDFYKNSLSDDGYLAIGVGYDDNNEGAVLITQVPEPTTMVLLPMIGVGLLARRKRRR